METKMEQITTEMMEYICDNLCAYPDTASGEKLEEICTDCKMSGFVCGILNEYNRINEGAI